MRLAIGEIVYATSPVTIVGDFNGDGSVDATDYVVWRKGLGSSFTAADYNLWKANFGATREVGAAPTSVPELNSLLLLTIGCGFLTLRLSTRR